MVTYLLLFVIAFSLSWTLSPVIRRAAFRLGAVDLPGERKIHTVPTPRIGGVIIALSIAVTGLVGLGLEHLAPSTIAFMPTQWLPIIVGGIIVFLGGAFDDIRPLPVWGKFLIQSAGALVAIGLGVRIDHVSLFGGEVVELGVLALPLTFLWIVGMTNAFNLVDGLDGLAVGLGSIAAGTCALLFILRGEAQDALVLIVVLGALLGFLPHNFNPARIYLGDSGSLLIGYVLSVTAILGTQKMAAAMAVFIPLLVLGLPILDTLYSMFRRFMGSGQMTGPEQDAQENWTHAVRRMFRADQRHFHHRLIAIGFSHRNAVLMLYAIALGLSCFALLSVLAKYRNAGMILLTVVLAAAIGIGKLDYRDVKILRTGTLLRWYDNLAFDRRFFLGFIDLFLITSAYVVAFILKFYDGKLTAELEAWYLSSFPMVLIVQFLCFYLFGLYRRVWRAIGVGDLFKIVLAVCMGVIVSYSLVVIRNPPVGTISFFAIDLLVLGILAGAIRCAHRVLDYSHQRDTGHGGIALIYGAGRGGQLVLRELMQNTMFGLRPIGFIDDDPKLRNRTVCGVSVRGSSQDLAAILDDQLVGTLIISSKTIEEGRLGEVIRACKERGVPILQAEFQFRPLHTDGEPLAEQTVPADLPKEEHSLSI